MNINSVTTREQTQMRVMERAGKGAENGNQEMKQIMQQLPEESRNSIKQLMQGLEPSQRKDAISQIMETDFSNMNSDQITSYITNILTNPQQTNSDNIIDTLI